MTIIGISAYYHDAAAVLLRDGKIVAAVQEERFSRIKNDSAFPSRSIQYCLEEAGLQLHQVDAVVFYEKPFLKFERLLETYLNFSPRGIRSFIKSMSVWVKDKLFLKKMIRDELVALSGEKKITVPIYFSEHHLSHAASAYYASPYDEAAVLTIDAVGEMASTSIYHGKGNTLTSLKEMKFPHSVGLLYSAFTYFLGFEVNNGEYKLMGLAPYGDENAAETKRYISIIQEKLCTIFEDGSIFLHQHYFNYATGLTMVNDADWEKLFGFKKREGTEVTQQHANLALAIQLVTEEIVLKLARDARHVTGCTRLCLAGGGALNCVANGRIQKAEIFEDIFIQPAAGDAGGALGAALAFHHIFYEQPKEPAAVDAMQGAYLGPQYHTAEIEIALKRSGLHYTMLPSAELYKQVAGYIANEQVVGWFQGRMEFGPRALGNRSILANPRSVSMQKTLNLKIKFRESFRPFAPVVLHGSQQQYFDIKTSSPYMLLVQQVAEKLKKPLPADYQSLPIRDKLNIVKSELPAITHVNGTARIQTAHENTNPRLCKLLEAFSQQTGLPMLINTSFNVNEEPIVCTPAQAIDCFCKTGMDVLVLNDFVVLKADQDPEILAKISRLNQPA